MAVLDELDGRLFADVPEVARLTGRDPRTIRAAAEAGQIPATKVGKNYAIPTSWIREQMGQTGPVAKTAPLDLDDLADKVADRLFARFARVLGASEAA